jgi:hygromycin-B 7''-O-kinase
LGAFLIQGNKELLREFLSSYGYLSNGTRTAFSHHLTALMLLHKYSNLNLQVRIKNWQESEQHERFGRCSVELLTSNKIFI